MRYKLHFPFGNRPDLLRAAVESVRDIGHIHLWANGIPMPTDIPNIEEFHEPGPVTIVSLINMCLHSSWNDDVCLIMHNDAEAEPGIAKQWLDFVTETFDKGERWGAIFSHYDVLIAFNMKAVHDVGFWDLMYFQYTADVDYYHSMKMRDWAIIDWPDGHPFRNQIKHHGSTQRKSDNLFSHRTAFRDRSDFDYRYYEFKWGGRPGKERSRTPFPQFKNVPWSTR
jgi:hypothetical protein